MIYIFIHKNVTKIFVSYTQDCVYLQYQNDTKSDTSF